MDRKESRLTGTSRAGASRPITDEVQPIEDGASEISVEDQTQEDEELRLSISNDRALGDFILSVWKIKKEKLETEELFKAVDVLTERERRIDDLRHRRRVTNFLFATSGAAFFFVLLQGLGLIELPVSFLVGVGSITGISAGVLRHFVKRNLRDPRERRE